MAVESGLSKEKALKALTMTPAEILGEQARIGAIKPGMLANFLISSGDLFDSETVIYQNWIQGQKQELNPLPQQDLEGKYLLLLGKDSLELQIRTHSKGYQGKLIQAARGDQKAKETDAGFVYTENKINMLFKHPSDTSIVRISGWKEGGQLFGSGDKQGENISWSAVRIASLPSDTSGSKKSEAEKDQIGAVIQNLRRQGNVHAVGWRASDIAHAGALFAYINRRVHRQGIGLGAVVVLGRDHLDLGEFRQLGVQGLNARRVKAIVIG